MDLLLEAKRFMLMVVQSLTVSKRKNRCIPYVYRVAVIFSLCKALL